MTYFGQIGGDLFFKTSATGDDVVRKDITGAESSFAKNKLSDANWQAQGDWFNLYFKK